MATPWCGLYVKQKTRLVENDRSTTRIVLADELSLERSGQSVRTEERWALDTVTITYVRPSTSIGSGPA